jgi:hypothetical protein
MEVTKLVKRTDLQFEYVHGIIICQWSVVPVFFTGTMDTFPGRFDQHDENKKGQFSVESPLSVVTRSCSWN